MARARLRALESKQYHSCSQPCPSNTSASFYHGTQQERCFATHRFKMNPLLFPEPTALAPSPTWQEITTPRSLPSNSPNTTPSKSYNAKSYKSDTSLAHPEKSSSESSFLQKALSVLLLRKQRNPPSSGTLLDFRTELNSRLDFRGTGPGRHKRLSDSYETISFPPSWIPEEISFDRMMRGATCPPLNRHGFYKFLKTVDHNSENFAFWICMEHYTKLFNAIRDDQRYALSSEWTREDDEIAKHAINAANKSFKDSPITIPEAVFSPLFPPGSISSAGSFWDASSNLVGDTTPPRTSQRVSTSNKRDRLSETIDLVAPFETLDCNSACCAGSTVVHIGNGPNLPVAVQNMWIEINHLIVTYILPSARHSLNLSSREREHLLYALKRSNHPSAFHIAFKCADNILRNDSYPKFLQLVKYNHHRVRQQWTYFVGWVCVTAGIVASGVLCMSKYPRYYGVFASPMLICGVAVVWAANHGLCVLLYGLGRYQVKPWEVYDDEAAGVRIDPETFLGGVYKPECRDWVRSYGRRYRMRKIFDRELPVQDQRVRDTQWIIFWQSLFVGFMITTVLMVLFILWPTLSSD